MNQQSTTLVLGVMSIQAKTISVRMLIMKMYLKDFSRQRKALRWLMEGEKMLLNKDFEPVLSIIKEVQYYLYRASDRLLGFNDYMSEGLAEKADKLGEARELFEKIIDEEFDKEVAKTNAFHKQTMEMVIENFGTDKDLLKKVMT
jgi:hypothetical protein